MPGRRLNSQRRRVRAFEAILRAGGDHDRPAQRFGYVGEGVGGSRIYCGTSSRAYFDVTHAGLVRTRAVVLPHAGRWFFAATADDTNRLESDWSNEVEWEGKPVAPVPHDGAVVRLRPIIDRGTNRVDCVSTAKEATFFSAMNAVEFFRTR